MGNTEDMKEKLSALVDNELNELDERRVLAVLDQDEALRHTWERYHLVRAALQQDIELILPKDAAARVSAQVAQESLTAASFPRAAFLRHAGMLAIAASVAVIAVAGIHWWPRPASTPIPAVASKPAAPETIIRAGTTRWNLKEPETESALNAFLVEHNEFASTSGIGGMMPYVRVVGYDNTK